MGRYLDIYDLSLDEGPSGGERRHAIVASGSVLLPWDITIGALYIVPHAAAVVGDRRPRPERRQLQHRSRAGHDAKLGIARSEPHGGQRLSHAQRSGGDQRSGHRQLAHQHHGHSRQQGDPVRRARSWSCWRRPSTCSTRRTCRRSSAGDASATRSRTPSAASPARGRHARSSWPSRRCGDGAYDVLSDRDRGSRGSREPRRLALDGRASWPSLDRRRCSGGTPAAPPPTAAPRRPATAATPPPPPIPARSTSPNIESIDAFYLRDGRRPAAVTGRHAGCFHRPVRRSHRRSLHAYLDRRPRRE